MLARKAPGIIEAVQFHVGGLVGLGVLARGFAEGRGVRGGIEDVVDDLESQAEMPARETQRVELRAGRVAAESAGDQGRGEHGGGFVEMDEFEFFTGRVAFLFREQVFHLSANEPFAAGGFGQFAGEGGREGRSVGVVPGDELESEGEQRVTRQERGGFVELLVRGRAAAAQVVVVHARQVVVNQRVGVDALQRDGGGEGIVFRAKAVGHGEGQYGAQALAAAEERIAHRFVQAGRAGVARRDQAVETLLNAVLITTELGGEFHEKSRNVPPVALIGKWIVNGELRRRTGSPCGPSLFLSCTQRNRLVTHVAANPLTSMANKKIEKALYGPSTVEVALGAILGLILGLVFACVYLVFKPVLQVKELPKETARGAVYFIPGSDATPKAKGLAAKQKVFIAGGSIELSEDELNAWSTATFAVAPVVPPAGKPGAKPAAPAPAAAPGAPALDGIFNPDRPNFKITNGTLQIGFKCVLNWYGLTHEVIVLTTGTIQPSGDGFVYTPTTFFLGSCPVHLIPGAAKPLLAHLLGKKRAPDEINSAWAKASDVTLEGSTLKITMK